MRFTKGHGTGNDFVIVDGSVDLNPALVAGICDRRFGIGGDGVLRVLRQDDLYFMDYWNSDGSSGEMCGNGVRVFVRYLLEAGLVTGSRIPIATRAGVRTAYLRWDGITVDMGAPRVLGRSTATVAGHVYDGVGMMMGVPHLVCEVDSVAGLDLTRMPEFDKEFFPEGVNIDFMERLAPGQVRMRVYERGAGETLSCGTGACAVGFAALTADPARSTSLPASGEAGSGHSAGSGSPVGAVTVDLPGGRLRVTIGPQTTWLTGPAVLVASGEIDLASLK